MNVFVLKRSLIHLQHFRLDQSSDKGSKIIVLGIGGKGKLNLQTAFPLFLHVLECLCLCKFTSSVKSSESALHEM